MQLVFAGSIANIYTTYQPLNPCTFVFSSLSKAKSIPVHEALFAS